MVLVFVVIKVYVHSQKSKLDLAPKLIRNRDVTHAQNSILGARFVNFRNKESCSCTNRVFIETTLFRELVSTSRFVNE